MAYTYKVDYYQAIAALLEASLTITKQLSFPMPSKKEAMDIHMRLLAVQSTDSMATTALAGKQIRINSENSIVIYSDN